MLLENVISCPYIMVASGSRRGVRAAFTNLNLNKND
jgi:hypothetical protein